ncbi:MAG: hypothetical protein ACU843_07780 [Gammaproteobacteria bacterium]
MGRKADEKFRVCQNLTSPDAAEWYKECRDRQIPLIFVLVNRGRFAKLDWDCCTAVDEIPSKCRMEQSLSRKISGIFSDLGLSSTALRGDAFIGQAVGIPRKQAPEAAQRLAELLGKAAAIYGNTCEPDPGGIGENV